MKIFVTGTEGFIGKHMLDAMPDDCIKLSFDIKNNYKLRPKDIDISTYDWVIHLGAISSTTETDIKKVMDINLSWSIELFEECVKYGVNFQWASSASVYGKVQPGIKMREDRKPKPQNLYAMSKYLLEQYIITKNAPIVWQGFRYFNVYGTGEEHKGSQASPYTQFAKQARETGIIKVFDGSERYKRDFVHVDTVIKAHLSLLRTKSSGIFNVGTGNSRSFMDIAKDVAMIYDAKIETIPFPEHLRSHYQEYTCADMTKLRKFNF